MDMDDVEPAGMSLVDEVFFNVVTPFNRAIELTDFYFRFIGGRGDNDFVNTLKIEYFGDAVPFNEVGEDGVEVEWWGTVGPAEEDDCYIMTLDPHWMGLSPTYTINATGWRTYHIEYNYEKNAPLTAGKGYALALGADVHIVGNLAYADMFRFLYEDSVRELEVRVNAGEGDEMVVFDLCRDGAFVNYPVSGVFYWAVSGSNLRNVKIVFYGDYFEVIEAEEIGADVESLHK